MRKTLTNVNVTLIDNGDHVVLEFEGQRGEAYRPRREYHAARVDGAMAAQTLRNSFNLLEAR